MCGGGLGILEDVRARAGGCHCHPAERLAGQRPPCAFAGRRGREAWGRVQQALRDVEELVARAPFAHPAIVVGPLAADLHSAAAVARGQLAIRVPYLDEAPCLLMRGRSLAAVAKLLAGHDAVLAVRPIA